MMEYSAFGAYELLGANGLFWSYGLSAYEANRILVPSTYHWLLSEYCCGTFPATESSVILDNS